MSGWRRFALPLLALGVALAVGWSQRELALVLTLVVLVVSLRQTLPPQPSSNLTRSGAYHSAASSTQSSALTEGEALPLSRSDLARFFLALDRAPVAILWLDARGRVRWLNDTAQGWLSYRAPMRQPLHVSWLLPYPEWWQELAAGSGGAIERVFFQEGVEKRWRLSWWPQNDGGLLWIEDSSERHRVDAMRRDFVANVSHELRTPLTLVIGYLETALEDAAGAQYDALPSYLERAHREAQRMLRLIQDLLQLAELEGTLPPKRLWLSVGEVLAQAEAHARALAQPGQEVSVLWPEKDYQVMADEHELTMALGNLVSNAVRYTPPPGSIELGCRETASGQLALYVRDSGIGIAPEHLPRLTERFYRVDRARSRASGGTGLGLAIVAHVAQRHEAKLSVRSQVGVGSEFSLVFPAQAWKDQSPIRQTSQT